MNRTADLDPRCSAPSSHVSVEVRINTTESLFGGKFKTLLQQNRPITGARAMWSTLELLRRFCSRTDASIATTFALALIPIMTAVGAAIDYSRANAVKAYLQSALDTALIAGAKDASSNWMQVAQNVFSGNLATKNLSAPTPTFTSE